MIVRDNRRSRKGTKELLLMLIDEMGKIGKSIDWKGGIMKYDEFIAKVRKRARLTSNEEAERATRATLQTIAERIGHAEANDLAAQLPDELAMYLRPLYADGEERFSLSEFFRRVGEREQVSPMEADYHARIVLALLAEV